MTQDTITAAEYRTAAKVMRSENFLDEPSDGYPAEARWCDERAATIESAAKRYNYLTELAGVFQSVKFGSLQSALSAVLDRLEADGRLVDAAGGYALTAQQLEDIRSLVGINGVIHARVRQETSRRLRASLDPWSLPPQPVERCRCGVLEDEPSDGCEWHAARAENAQQPAARICTNEYECPTCLARPYEFCTVSDHNYGRRQVSWVHAARTPEYRNA